MAILTLACFLLIFPFSSETHADYTADVVTAYTGNSIGQGGELYKNKQYKTVAVHQKSKTNKDPIYNFGTLLVTKKALYLDGYGNKYLFEVTDTGDLNRKRGLYWFDVYYGTSTTINKYNATKFGEKNKNVVYSTVE